MFLSGNLNQKKNANKANKNLTPASKFVIIVSRNEGMTLTTNQSKGIQITMNTPTVPENTAASTRTAGLAAIKSALPRKYRVSTVKGRGVSGANLSLSASRKLVPQEVQFKVIPKGKRGFSKVSKYLDVAPDGTVTGLKDVARDLKVVVAVLDHTGGDRIYVTTVGAIQDLMFADYTKRSVAKPDVPVKQTFYRPIDLGVDAGDLSAITDTFEPVPVVVAVEEVVAPAVVTVIKVDEGITAMVFDPAAMEIPVSDISLEDEVAEGEAEVLAELGF